MNDAVDRALLFDFDTAAVVRSCKCYLANGCCSVRAHPPTVDVCRWAHLSLPYLVSVLVLVLLLGSSYYAGQIATLQWAHSRGLHGFERLMDIAAWSGR